MMLDPAMSLLVRMIALMKPEWRKTVLQCFCRNCGVCIATWEKEGKIVGVPSGPLAVLDDPKPLSQSLCGNCEALDRWPLDKDGKLRADP